MLSPSYLESLPVGIVNQYAELENWIIADISRRIAGADYIMTPSAEWQIKKAQELRLSNKDVQKRIARELGITQKEVANIFKEAGIKSLRADKRIHALVGKEAICGAFMNNLATNRVFQAGIQQTNALMSNFCQSLAANSNKAFEKVLDQAWFEVASGAFSPQAAIRKGIKELSKQGLGMVVYKNGRRDYVEVAVRRAVITGVNITCARLSLDMARECECNLVETTAHMGARPDHSEWQGQVFALSKGTKYQTLEDGTRYGYIDGLCGANCRHNFYPFYEGISNPIRQDFTSEENAELYRLNQHQRSLERGVRKAKREVNALKSATEVNDDEAFKQDLDRAKKNLKARNDRLKQFVDEHDELTLRRDRVTIGGVGSNKTKKEIKNKPIKSESPQKNYESACKQVLERGKINGNENLLLVDLNGNQVFDRLDGSNNCVKFTPEFMQFLEDAKDNSLKLIHNHPRSSSFSDADMYVLSRYNSISEITAYGHDKTLYRLSMNGQYVRGDVIKKEYKKYRDEFNSKYQKLVEDGVLDPKEAWKQHSNDIIEAMAKSHKWNYTREVLE